MTMQSQSHDDLLRENEVLRQRISEARSAIDSIKEWCLAAPPSHQLSRPSEKELASTALSFQFLVESMPQGAAVVSTEGAVLYANASLMKRTALGPDRNVFDFVSAQDRPFLIDLFQGGAGDGTEAKVTFRRPNADPYPACITLRPGLPGSNAYCMLVSDDGGDIRNGSRGETTQGATSANSDAEDVESAHFQEQARRYHLLVDDAPVMLWLSTVNGECTFLSRGWYTFTGQTHATGLGLGRLEIVHPSQSEQVQRAYFRAHVDREPFELKYQVKTCDETYRWVSDCARPRFAESGAFLGYIGAILDITAQVEAEQRTMEKNAALERRVKQGTQQLRALALELGQTKHRERKKLARELHDNIQQMLVAVKIQARLAEPANGTAGTMNEVIRLADETILACRSIVAGLAPPVASDSNLHESLMWLARWIQEQYDLKVEVEGEAPLRPTSRGTRTILFESARELLCNVVKHAGVNHARMRYWQGEGMAFVDIIDKGVGCENEVFERVDGQGFGLVATRERLVAAGGGLALKAMPGQGTHARAFVPLTIPEETPFQGPPANSRPTPKGKVLRVLLADDHQILRQGLAKLLATQSDVEVVAEASDGAEALELARELNPDVVIMDISMPRMSGIEATAKLRADFTEIRVLGLSMHESKELAHAMLQAGAEAYLTKSGPIDELLAALRGKQTGHDSFSSASTKSIG